jgi:hypothetical protein
MNTNPAANENHPDTAPPAEYPASAVVGSSIIGYLMAGLWLALFGGRWLGVQWLAAGGMIDSADVARLDNGLTRCYAALICVTVPWAAYRRLSGRSVRGDPSATDPTSTALQPGDRMTDPTAARAFSKGSKCD